MRNIPNLFWFLKQLPTITKESKINKKIVVGQWFGKRTIFVDNVAQSGGELVVMWKTVIKKLKEKNFYPKKCLVLGVGGGDVFKELKNHYSTASVVGVDIDPVMVVVARKYFGLKTRRIIISDAFLYISKQKDKTYDLIIVDLFVGRNNPDGARTKKFLVKIKKILKKNGCIVFNSHYRSNEEHKSFIEVCQSVFKTVEPVFAYRLNRVLLLSETSY